MIRENEKKKKNVQAVHFQHKRFNKKKNKNDTYLI